MTAKRKQHGEVSMFSEEEFANMAKIFCENNPALATGDDPDGIRKEINSLISEIEGVYEAKENGWQEAINILLQGVNFLARFIGELEFYVPGLPSLGEETPPADPISDKKVAIFISGNHEPIARALKKTLEMVGAEEVRYDFFDQASPLLKLILSGEICGVIGFDPGTGFDIESLLRHDLKYMPHWDYAKALDYALPPCANFGMPWSIADLVGIMACMQKGDLEPTAEEDFSLVESMRILKTHMTWPDDPVYISIIDDVEAEIEGMAMILKYWPGISVVSFINNVSYDNVSRIVSPETSIVLLDEDLRLGLKGTQIAESLRKNGYRGLIASTTGGATPAWAQWHFQRKMQVAKNFTAAREFVKFMNSLLR